MLNKELLNYTHFASSNVNLFPILRVHWDSSLHLGASQIIEFYLDGSMWIQLPSMSFTLDELYTRHSINTSTLNAMLLDDLPSEQLVSGSRNIDYVEKSIIYVGTPSLHALNGKLDTYDYRIRIVFRSINGEITYTPKSIEIDNPNEHVTCEYNGQRFLITTNGNPVYNSYFDCLVSFN